MTYRMRMIIIRSVTASRAPQDEDPTKAPPAPKGTARRVDSRTLLGGARELVIDHEGREYRLRLTQNGKLILTA